MIRRENTIKFVTVISAQYDGGIRLESRLL